MSRNTAIFLASFILTNLITFSYELEFPPPPLQKCHFKDDQCWIKQAVTFLKTYDEGIPELNIKPLNPLEIDDFVIKNNANSATAFNLSISDMKMFKLTNIQVADVKFLSNDPTKPVKIQITLFAAQSTVKSKYKINGKILILPIQGEGEAIINLKNITVKANVIMKFEKHDDEKSYLKDIDVKILSKSDDANIYLSNLFNGRKELADNILKVLNDNWTILSADFNPNIHKSLAKHTITTMNALLKDVPYEDWYLKD